MTCRKGRLQSRKTSWKKMQMSFFLYLIWLFSNKKCSEMQRVVCYANNNFFLNLLYFLRNVITFWFWKPNWFTNLKEYDRMFCFGFPVLDFDINHFYFEITRFILSYFGSIVITKLYNNISVLKNVAFI